MKFAAFAVDTYEIESFNLFKRKYNIDIDIYNIEINQYDCKNAYEYDGISIISLDTIDNAVLDRFTNLKVISLRSIGFQYLDLDYCKNRNIIVTNASYEPYNVADFTIMQMLMLLRKAKVSICRALVNDFSLEGMNGRELRNQTIGIIGTGKIGTAVIKELSGFGSKIYCHDIYEKEELKQFAEYKDLDYIYKNCDIISLHMPLTKDNHHIIDKEAIKKMKQGVIIINNSRGGLVDTSAIIEGIETLKIGACAFDTFEGEEGLAHVDLGANVDGLSKKRDIMYLKQFANVLITQHYAFFTNEAVESMVECSFKTFNSLINNKNYENKIN